MRPCVSVIVNNYNYAQYLPQSIESALAQTYPDTEVIVVDDASTDRSVAIIAQYEGRIRPVFRAENGGQGAALNAGFAASRGEIVIFLDSDDWLYPEAVASVVNAWTPALAKVHYRLDLVDDDGSRLDLYPAPEIAFDDGDVRPILLETGRYETSVMTGNAFARRVLERILPVPEEEFRRGADGYVVTVAPLFGEVASIETPLGTYRVHAGSLSAVDGTDRVALGRRCRIDVLHDLDRHAALARFASELGLEVRGDPALRDHVHLTKRIASLCVEPEKHPCREDRRFSLAVRGAWACRRARFPMRRRLVLAAWFLSVGVLPVVAARRAVGLRLVKASRSARADRLLGMVRRLTR